MSIGHVNLGRGRPRVIVNPVLPVMAQLRAARLERGRSIVWVSERTGYDKKAISNWERGVTKASFHSLQDYANALGLEFVLVKAS